VNAADERAALRRIAETEADEVAAVAAALIGHAELRDGMRWACACGLDPAPGSMHARHVAEELLDLLARRAVRL
jgi:hypothetical protein